MGQKKIITLTRIGDSQRYVRLEFIPQYILREFIPLYILRILSQLHVSLIGNLIGLGKHFKEKIRTVNMLKETIIPNGFKNIIVHVDFGPFTKSLVVVMKG